ncbi:nucleotidyltransferase domain-containing protein [Patescibacteria group bacterium]|nr:nucleotidyltransferase domain-containing protein [Patescibacteria group bacterium]
MAKKKLPIIIKKTIDQYLEILKKDKLPIKKVILFGSYAKGEQHKWSDIDLCIISSAFNRKKDPLDYLWSKRIVNKNVHIEPIGFHPKDFVNESPLVWEIKKTGKII